MTSTTAGAPALARALWRELEAINGVTYFAPECRQAAKDVGLRGFWMGYFACRTAPMGAVSPAVVEATFFNFHPAMVRRALPDAWRFATPTDVVAARQTAAGAAIKRLAPAVEAVVAKAAPPLTMAIDNARGAGRPLFAANRDLVAIADGTEALWQAATTLREHRGDGHVAVLTESGLDGCEAHVLYAATERVPPELLREARGWSTEDWDEAAQRLVRRGLLDQQHEPTATGADLRRRIEQRTDELAVQPYEVLEPRAIDDLLDLLRSVAGPIATSGLVPFPNPMGLPKPA